MKSCVALSRLLIVVCMCAAAQNAPNPPPNPPPSAKPEEKPPDIAGPSPDLPPGTTPPELPPGTPPPDKPPEAPAGDVITLKSGNKLTGVQVVSRSPTDIEVDVGDGILMKISRKQIVDIKYDKIEPVKRKSSAVSDAAVVRGDVIQGSQITAEVSAKLTAPIPDPPLKYENQDLVVILDELSKRLGITIIVDDPVKALPDNERQWSIESGPDTTLMSLLQDRLLKQFPGLGVVYQYDKLLVTTKEAADTIAAKESQSGNKTDDEKPAMEDLPPEPPPGTPPPSTPPKT